MGKNKAKVLVVVVVVIVLAIGWSLFNGGTENTNGEADSVNKAENLEGAREFKEFESADLQGNVITAEDVFTGQDLTVINLWGTFCGPCIREMPDLGELAEEYSDKGVKFVGIPVDVRDEETLVTAIDIVEKTEANYLHLLPTEDLYNIYLKNVTVIPETLFVDKTGTIIKSVKSARSKEEWKILIDEVYEQVV